MEKLIERIKELGWAVDVEGTDYRISQYSPAGQDFSIRVEAGDSVEDVINNIKEVYEDYDVSEETYKWLDTSGHGVNGAPYDMKDLYEDMEACQSLIWHLWEKLKEE